MRLSDRRRTGLHFERLNGQKHIRAAAGNEADSIIIGGEEGRKSQQATPLDDTETKAGDLRANRRPAGAHSRADGDGSITVTRRAKWP